MPFCRLLLLIRHIFFISTGKCLHMTSNNDKDKTKQDSNQPTNTDPMDSPRDVEKSNDENIDEDFPGYPHYPAKDDILNPDNHTERVDVDVDNLTRSNSIDNRHLNEIKGVAPVEGITSQVIPDENDDDIGIVAGTDADVTAEDLALLGSRDDDMDMGEDEELKARGYTPQTGTDLDIPDADMNDEAADSMGQEDEENSYYSLGGDSKDSLEEDVRNDY
jgi:hypothetical protein